LLFFVVKKVIQKRREANTAFLQPISNDWQGFRPVIIAEHGSLYDIQKIAASLWAKIVDLIANLFGLLCPVEIGPRRGGDPFLVR